MTRESRLPSAVVLAGSCLLASACVQPEGEAAPDTLAELFADRLAVVDLTHSVSANAPYWPGPETSPFRHDTLIAHEDGSPLMASYAVPEHFGTHFDAPIHGGMGLASVDRVPPEELFGPAVVIDVSADAATDPDRAVSVEDVLAWEAAHGPIPAGAIVLVRSGWSRRWSEGAAYYNVDDAGVMHFPGFAADAARFLVEERDIAGVGSDSGSVDTGSARGLPVHGIVNGSGRFHLENVANLEALPTAGAYLVVAPIKIEGGSGGQVRIFGIVP